MTEQITAVVDRPHVGFIGLGDMGGGMATNIVRKGFSLRVFDLRREAVDRLVSDGAEAASSVAELASSVDVLCTCVVYDHQVRDIFLGDDGVIANARPGLVALIHSTVLPATVQAVATAAASAGVEIIDAPVSGASTRSREGTLSVMVGAGDEAFAAALSVLEAFSAHVFRVGAPGSGQVAKLANNIMSLCNQAITMEAVRFAESLGLDRHKLFEIASVSSGGSWASDNYEHFDQYGVVHPLAGTDELPVELTKDLRTALSVAQEGDTFLPVLALCSQLMPEMYAKRWAEASTTATA